MGFENFGAILYLNFFLEVSETKILFEDKQHCSIFENEFTINFLGSYSRGIRSWIVWIIILFLDFLFGYKFKGADEIIASKFPISIFIWLLNGSKDENKQFSYMSGAK